MAFDAMINCGGLSAQKIARAMPDYPAARVPKQVLAKGNYFTYVGKPAFTRLIYPTPVTGGLGVHVTLDLAGRMRFGPDVEWIDKAYYPVDPKRADVFYERIRTYWPAFAGWHAGAGLFRHPAEAHRTGRTGGRLRHRHAGRARPAGAGADVRH